MFSATKQRIDDSYLTFPTNNSGDIDVESLVTQLSPVYSQLSISQIINVLFKLSPNHLEEFIRSWNQIEEQKGFGKCENIK
jgi:hypothetical protein